MKTFSFFIVSMLLCFTTYAQTFKSPYVIKGKTNFATEMKDRVIIISDKEISISNFIGGTKTQYLIVNKIEEKDYNGIKCRYYYCTTKDEDIINGYQKAIVIKEFDTVHLGLFATEIDIYKYQFSISRY